MPVSPYKGEIFPIPFGQSGMIAHEDRWLAKSTELVRAENVTFENDALQKDAAYAVYDPIGVDAPLYRMTASSTLAGDWDGGWTLLTAVSGAPSLLKNIVVTGQSSPWTFTIAGAALPGALIVISLYAPATNPPTFTDSQGNIYTEVVGFNVTNAPSDPTTGSYYQYHAPVVHGLSNGVDTITLTFTGGGTKNFWLIATAFAATGTPFDFSTAIPTATTAFSCPAITPAPPVALKSYVYPLVGIGGAFLSQDTAAATVTGTLLWTKFQTANRAGVGQLGQFYTANVIQGPAIVAQTDWNSQFNAGAIAGTVTVTQNSTVITGAGTSFLTAFAINDEIIINNEARSIASITNNATLNTYTPWIQTTAAGQAAKRRAGPKIITAALGSTSLGAASLTIWKERNPGSFYPTPGLAGYLLLTDSNQPRLGRFVVAGKESSAQSRKLFFFNGVEPVSFLADDGTTMTAIPGPPADWGGAVDLNKQPINGILHQGALFGWGNLSDPHRIYRSQTADHTTFTGGESGQYPIASSIGERLWCGAEYQGVLFLWKYPRGIFYFDDTDSDYLNWSYHIRSEGLGCAPSPHAALAIDDDVLFCAPDGHFHLLSAVADLGGARTSDITRMLGLHRWTRENLHIPSLVQMCSVWNPYGKTAYFGVRSRTATTQDNDLLLKFDFSQTARGGPIRFSYSTAYRPNALCVRRSATTGSPKDGTPLLMIGELSTSILQVLDDGTIGTKLTHGFRNDPVRESRLISTSYAIVAGLPRIDFVEQDPQNRQRRKHFDAIEFVFGESDISDLSAQTLTAQVFIDGALKQTLTIANITNTRVTRPLRVGDGYDIQITLSTASIASTAAVSPTLIPDIFTLGVHVYWRPGGQDQDRPS